jgi:hypothetical protein
MSSRLNSARLRSWAALKNLRFHSDMRTSKETTAILKTITATTRTHDFHAREEAK